MITLTETLLYKACANISRRVGHERTRLRCIWARDTPLTRAVSGGALSDIDAPLFGGCRTAAVRALLAADPGLRVPDSPEGRRAIWWARFHDCEEVLSLVATWTSHTAADKIVTAGGVVKDALGVRSPKDVMEGRH